MRVSDFDFELPDELIAARPVTPRESARLLVLRRDAGTWGHHHIGDLPELLAAGDLLVVNDTRVLPHRLVGRRATGGRVEVLILEREGERGRGYLKPATKVRIGDELAMEDGALVLRPLEALGAGLFQFALTAREGDVEAALERVGRAPLPPYLRRPDDADRARDRADYQTVFATRPGAVAAPTAGLHFTPELLARLAERGIGRTEVTLHVGEGTFAPVRVEDPREHRMHREVFEVPAAAAHAIDVTRARGGRIVAVGTTSARALESRPLPGRRVAAGAGETELFLYPGRELQVIDALLTNFHLPQSTLLMLVSAFAGRELVLDAYRDAVEQRYRFFSFGDAMLIL